MTVFDNIYLDNTTIKVLKMMELKTKTHKTIRLSVNYV
jgi:hypothetical protein